MRYVTAIAMLGLAGPCVARAGIVGAPKAEAPAPTVAKDARPIYKIVADLTKGNAGGRSPAAAEGGAQGGYKPPGKHAASRGPYDAEVKRAKPEPDVKRTLVKRGHKRALQSTYGSMQSIQQRKSIAKPDPYRSPMASERVLQKRNYNATHTRHGANKSYSNPYKAQPIRKR
jgi:hypothetical protein